MAVAAVGVALPAGAGAGLSGVLTLYEPNPVVIPNGAGAARMSFEDPNGGDADSVTVGFRVRHSRTQQLDISVKDPDGDRVSLSEGETKGEDLGTGGCPEQNPDTAKFTSFRQTMAQPLSAGTAPYTGYFLPHESLAAVTGPYGPGNWTLIVKDTHGGVAGKLRCGYVRLSFGPGR